MRIATRQSKLALAQTEEVKQLLLYHFPQLVIELVPMSTKGDQIQDRSLAELGGKGLFIKNLEDALLQKQADCAVHSLKDMPPQLSSEFTIAAVLKRLSPNDVLVSKCGKLMDLPKGAIIGTSSVRRRAELLSVRPDLKTVFIRGNVETRLGKLDAGFCDALILAEAGLMRLDLTKRITEVLDTKHFLPSVGQGVIAIEILTERKDLLDTLAPLNDPHTLACINAERAMNSHLGASCTSPVGSFAEIKEGQLTLHGAVFSQDGQTKITTAQKGNPADALTLGKQAAEALLHQGAKALL